MGDDSNPLSADSLFTAARRLVRNIRADEASGGLLSLDSVKATELLARHVDTEDRRIKAESAKAEP